jgi:hypothetical protein
MNRFAAPHTQLMLNLMGSFAEFEREIMLERQREPRGISTLGETAQAKIPEWEIRGAECDDGRHARRDCP